MRDRKTEAIRRQTLTTLLRELKTPHITWRLGDDYRLHIAVYDEHEADEFRKLLFIKIGFSRVREKINVTAHCHLIEVTWNECERERLIKNIEEYLQEDNMGPTNINKQNTKFYAIVADERGKETAYEITHLSLESRMEYCFGESTITHRVEFDQDRLVPCNCTFAEWAKQKDELEKLRAEKDALAKRLGECEDQLRRACEFLNGYGDVHIDISQEMEDLDNFSGLVNYMNQGETNRREFGKKVAENVRKRAGWHGVWREPGNAETMVKDNKILDDAVEAAMNPFYISCPKVCGGRPRTVIDDAIDFTAGLTHSDTDTIYIQQRMSGSSKAMEMIKDMVDKRRLQLRLNSIYGLTAASIEKANKAKGIITPIFDAYDSIKDVKFANPATIVFWTDGTKTVVKTQGDEEYVPEVGLAMCICKKVMGNTRDYYRVFKHWMKKV